MTAVYEKNRELFLRVNPSIHDVISNYKSSKWEWCETEKGEKNLKQDINGHPFYLHSQKGAMDEIQKWFFHLDKISGKAIFIFGLGLGYHYQLIKEWLRNDPARFLVFIEDDLEVIQHFLTLEQSFDLLNDPQVILRFFYLPKEDYHLFKAQFNSLLAGFFHHFPSFHALESYRTYRGQMFQVLSQMITLSWGELNMSYSTILKSSFYEDFKNSYENYPYLYKSYSFDKLKGLFKDIPTLMCGAGPSLEAAIPLIKNLENSALIIAGGSALNALSSHSILPHFGCGVDPSLSQKSRFMSNFAYEVPIIFMTRFHYQAFPIIKGPMIYVKGLIGFPVSYWFEHKWGLYTGEYESNYGISSPTFLTTIMAGIGTKRIYLLGMDLSYPNQKRYSSGIQAHPTDILEEKKYIYSAQPDSIPARNSHGDHVQTSLQMKFEASYYSEFAQTHPDISVINTTLNGLEIFNIPHQSLESVAFDRTYDLLGRVHAAIQNGKIALDFPAIKSALDEWKKSFENCKEIGEGLLKKLKKGESAIDLNHEFGNEDAFLSVLAYYLIFMEPDFFLDHYQIDCHPERFTQEEIAAKQHHYQERRLSFLVNAAKWHAENISQGLDHYAEHERLLHSFTRKSILKPPERLPEKNTTPDISPADQVTEVVNEVDGKWEGVYRIYYPSGTLFGESHYAKGVLHGPSRYYDEQKNLLSEVEFVNGQREGDHFLYYPSGKVYGIQRFKNGRRHGRQEYYYPTGILKSLIHYSDGLLEGNVNIYHENGANERQLTFIKGKLNGYEYGWSANEKLIHQSEYAMGTPINQSKVWSQNGKLIQQYNYHADTGKFDFFTWDEQGKILKKEIYVPDNAFELIKNKSEGINQSIAALKAELDRLKKEKMP